MISIRRIALVLVIPIGLPAMAPECFSGGIDQPPAYRGPLPVGQPAPVRASDQNRDRPSSVGVQEVSRPDGGQDIIYYSATPPEEKAARDQAEIRKQEKSLELLDNTIIFRR
jgi:hypothetical protein